MSVFRHFFCGDAVFIIFSRGVAVWTVPQCLVHSPVFFRKIIEIERFALRAAILRECQNYLGSGDGLGGNEKNLFYFSRPPCPRAIIPDAPPSLGTLEKQDTVTIRRGISKRSHEKIGDCEQSTQCPPHYYTINPYGTVIHFFT